VNDGFEMRTIRALALPCFLFLLIPDRPAEAQQRTIYVFKSGSFGGEETYPTIQQAVDAANDGDSIRVLSDICDQAIDTFDENIVIEGKSVTISSACYGGQQVADPEYSPCGRQICAIVNGRRAGRCMRIKDTGDKPVRIIGIKFTGGFQTDVDDYGGGILIQGETNVTIMDCMFNNNAAWGGGGIGIVETTLPVFVACNVYRGNIASFRGGAVCGENHASPVFIQDSVFVFNTTELLSGGAIFSRSVNSANMDIVRNTFKFNECNTSRGLPPSPLLTPARGGAIGLELLNQGFGANVVANDVSENRSLSGGAGGGGDGGGIAVQGATNLEGGGLALLHATSLTDNVAEDDGGGLYVSRAGRTSIDNSEFLSNRAAEDGGGLQITCDSQLTIRRSRIESNIAGESGGGVSIRNAQFIGSSSLSVTFNRAVIGGGLVFQTASDSPASCNPPSVYGQAIMSIVSSSFLSNVATGNDRFAPIGAHVLFSRAANALFPVQWEILRTSFL
jgi:hypothetical protein